MLSRICIFTVMLALGAKQSIAGSYPKLLREKGLYCSKEGLNPYPFDCTQFIVCAKNTEGGFDGAIYRCKDGEAFEENSLTCIPKDEVLRCKRRYLRQVDDTEIPPDSPPEPYNCNNKPMSCRDCNRLAICYQNGNQFVHLTDIECKENNQTTYCDESLSACTSKVPPLCGSSFACTGIGYFPDPSDCTKYHICHPEGDKIVAATQYCAANQVYSTSKKMCVIKIRITDCQKVTCPAGKTQNVAFSGDASYYAICLNGNPEYVFYCGESKQFNAEKNTCEIVCKEAGRIPDSEDCQKYYECTANRFGGTFTLTSNTCPTGTIYDKASQICVIGSCA